MNWGSCDYRQLQKIRNNLDRLERMDMNKFCQDVSKELAARLLALVIPRTPVGRYPKSSGKKGGTLRRGWTARTAGEAAAGSTTDAKAYAAVLPVSRQGRNFYVQVINPVEYASYVEFGHRTRGGKCWVNGQYFLTLSEHDLERLTPALIERKLEALLREVFRV
ncbi:MAG: HK97 gp10 family phage protein [Eubacteriales bacterium]|nr:HK97 gp10 family phage protein [Eubacteriales bacterium]